MKMIILSFVGDAIEKERLDTNIDTILIELKNKFIASLQVDEEDDSNLKKVPLYLIETISYFVHKMTFERGVISNDVSFLLII